MRKKVADKIVRALFAKSGNKCSFPGCQNILVKHNTLYVGEIAHIEAAEPGGPRYNSVQTDEERRAYGNLLLLCHEHHVEIDDAAAKFTVKILKRMKRDHEATVKKIFRLAPKMVSKVAREMEQYWRDIERINTQEHVIPERAIEIRAKSKLELTDAIKEQIQALREQCEYLAISDAKLNDVVRAHLISLGYNLEKYDAVVYYENPVSNRHWEIHNLAIENCFRRISVWLTQLEVKVIEEQLQSHSIGKGLRKRYDEAKTELREMAKGAGIAD